MITMQIPMREEYLFSQENASALAFMLSRFEASVMIHDQNRTVNAKSLLGILSLGYVQSEQLEFIIDGADENDVRAALIDHFSD